MSKYPVILLSKDFFEVDAVSTITCFPAGLWEATITIDQWRLKDARIETIRSILGYLRDKATDTLSDDFFDVVAGYLYVIGNGSRWRLARIADMEWISKQVISNFESALHTTCKWMSVNEVCYGMTEIEHGRGK